MTVGDLFDRAFFHVVQSLPMTASSNLGARLSPLLGRRARPDQHANAKALFARLRPDWASDEAALEAAANRLWANILRTYAEFGVSHRMLKAGRVGMEGRPILEAALASGRPIIALFVHLGNWELSAMQIGFMAPGRGTLIVAPPKERVRAVIAAQVRKRAPAEILPVSRLVWRHALTRLRTPGGGIMMVVDEQRQDGKVVSPALGGPPRTDGNLGKAARLALTTDALVVPFYNERLPDARFVTHILPVMEFAGAPNDAAAIEAAVVRMEDAFREPIRRLVDQWYMAIFTRLP